MLFCLSKQLDKADVRNRRELVLLNKYWEINYLLKCKIKNVYWNYNLFRNLVIIREKSKNIEAPAEVRTHEQFLNPETALLCSINKEKIWICEG